MNRLLKLVLCIVFIVGLYPITEIKVKADTTTSPNEVLNLNIQGHSADYSGVLLMGTSILDYGDLVCSISVYNFNPYMSYRVPIYVKGKDSSGKVIEVASAYVDVPNGQIDKFEPVGNATIKLKAGYLIKSLETGIVEEHVKNTDDDKIILHSYGIRRDDVQNKIIITGIIKNGVDHSASIPDVPLNGGIVASGYDGNRNIIEVNGASENILNGCVKTFEVTLLAGSLISDVNVRIAGNTNNSFFNLYGNRVEKGTNIITGSIENNAFNQYVQLIAKGYSKGQIVEVDGQTIDVKKNSQTNYRFELSQSNNIDKVEVTARQQASVTGTAQVVAYSTHKENNILTVDALVSSGYYKDKNLGITASGLDKSGNTVETNTQTIQFTGNRCQLQHVRTTLNAVTLISKVNVELAGSLENQIKLIKCGYRIENDTCLVTSVIENGNTIPQIAGVKVLGYDKNGKVIEVTGYSGTIPANNTMQFNSMLTNTKDIFKVKAEFVGLVKGKIQSQTSSYKAANNVVVSGVLINGDARQNAGVVAIGKDSKGNVVDTNYIYISLDHNTVTPFVLKLNSANRIYSINTYTVEANSLSSKLFLDAVGYYQDQDKMKINAVVTNGTSLNQTAGILSIGYDSKGKPIDMIATPSATIPPLTVTKLENSFSNKNVVTVKSVLFGVKCSTGISATALAKDSKSKAGTYYFCLQNGAPDQDFIVSYTPYDLKGKKMPQVVQKVNVQKYCAKVVNISFDLSRVSKILLKVYDAAGKRIA